MYSLAWALLAAAATRAVPTQDADWQSITCDTTNVTDARVDSYIRWNAADTNESWQAVVAAWQAYNPGQDQVPLKFGAFVSNYFNGPEAWDCQDPTNVPCSTTVGCWSVSHPAGYMILNSFAKLHMIFFKFHEAMQDAQLAMTGNIGQMMSVFAPDPHTHDPALIEKMVFDTVQIFVLFCTAYLWNIWCWGFSYFGAIGIKQNFKDSFNAVGTGIWSYSKDSRVFMLPLASKQDMLMSSMDYMFGVYRMTQTEYLDNLFSGADNGSLAQLEGLIANGMMNELPDNIDLTDVTEYFVKVITAQLIPKAWNLNRRRYTPFVLATGDACSDTVPLTLSHFMSQSTHVSAGQCWEGNQFYVLTVSQYDPTKPTEEAMDESERMKDRDYLLNSMTGGRHSDLDGQAWSGITLEDIVVSSYYGYLNNGNRNGYNISLDDSNGQVDLLMFESGIRTPGFFSLPVCTNMWTLMANLVEGREDEPDFPCGAVVEKPIPGDMSKEAKYFEGIK